MRTTLAILVGLVLAGSVSAQSATDLLKRFAPVIVQNCHGRADYLTRFDYDGDFNGQNNWDNFDRVLALPAYVYTAAIETTTHWYLTYSLFHPRDWWKISLPLVNHENDLEGILVVLEKKSGGEVDLLLMETVAHADIHRYSSHPALKDCGVEGPLRTEGEHPIVDVEGYKHGIRGWNGKDLARAGGVIYRYKGKAQQPESSGDRDCGYDFLTVKETFWDRRNEIGDGKMYGTKIAYPQGTFGARLRGDNYVDNAAGAPWCWSDKDDKGLADGDWFFQPARAMHVHYPKLKARFSAEYVQNEFLHEGASARDLSRAALFERASLD